MAKGEAGSGQRLNALTGARFIAGLYVLVFHYGAPLFAGAPAWLERLRSSGYVAVGYFFALSGFILAHQYGGEPVDRRKFWVARFSRLYPLYALGVLMLVPLALDPELGRYSFAEVSTLAKSVTFAAHLTLTQAWVPPLVGSWNIPGWSICVEAVFYASFIYLTPALFKLARAKLIALVVACWAVVIGMGVAYWAIDPDGLGVTHDHSRGFWLYVLKVNPIGRVPEFVFGICLGRLYREGLRLPEKWATAIALATTVGIGALLAIGPVPYPILHNGFLIPAFAVIIVALASGGVPLLATRPVMMLGEASYSLYILQFPLMVWAQALLQPAVATDTPLFSVLFMVGMLIVAQLSYRGIERPAQAWLKRWLDPKKRTRPVPAPVRAGSDG